MATITFLGRDDDWENLDNWDGHALPVDADDVIVPRTARSSLIRHVDRRCDSGGAGLDLNTFLVQRGYKGDIGSEGAPFCASVNSATTTKPAITHRGDGTLHFADIALHVVWTMLVNSPNHRNAVRLTGTGPVAPIGATLAIVDGHVHIGPSVGSFNRVLLGPKRATNSMSRRAPTSASRPMPRLTTRAGGLAYVYMRDGEVDSTSVCTEVNLAGGQWTQSDGFVTTTTVGQGRFILNSSVVQPLVYLMGGVYDTTQTDDAKAITNSYKYPSAVFKKSDSLTITKEYSMFDEEWDG